MSQELFNSVVNNDRNTYDRLVGVAALDKVYPGGDTLLLAAARHDRRAMFDDLFERDKGVLSRTDAQGRTCLHLVAARGDRAWCRAMVKSRSSLLFVADQTGTLPFQAAQNAGFDDVANELRDMRDFQGVLDAMSRGVDGLDRHFETTDPLEIRRLLALTDLNGDTILHHAAKRNLPKKRETGGDMIAKLVDLGADLDAPNNDGQTPLFGAALKCNNGIIAKLLERGALPNVTDVRGWTALDQAAVMGPLDPSTETLLAQGHATGKKVELGPVVKSTVDVLVAAALTDQKNDQDRQLVLDRFRTSLEELYRQPEFRPILDLAALNAIGERTPNRRPLRIYLSSGPSTITINGEGDRGSYSGEKNDTPTNSLALAMERPDEDMAGTLIHELTHHAAFFVYQNGGKPYPPDDQDAERRHLAAYEKMAKSTHLALGVQEKELSNTIVGRVANYGDNDKIQEFVAGVPQAVYLYGRQLVDELAPECWNDFKSLSTRSQDAVDNHNLQLDNADLLLKVGPLGPLDPAYGGMQSVPRAEVNLDKIVELVGWQFIAETGVRKNDDDGAPPPCMLNEFKPTDDGMHTNAVERVRQALALAFDQDALPPQVTGETLRILVGRLTALAKSIDDDQAFQTAVATTTKLWTRVAQTSYFESKIAFGEPLSDHDIAEATVLTAELRAWSEIGDTDQAPEVDGKKHRKLVESLEKELGRLDRTDPNKKQNIQNSALKFIQDQAEAIVGTKAKGVYKKPSKPSKLRNPDHVSIKVEKARLVWLEKLAAF